MPVFQGGKPLELAVEEEAAVGTVVGYVSAVDNDAGDNSMVDYRITCKCYFVLMYFLWYFLSLLQENYFQCLKQ